MLTASVSHHTLPLHFPTPPPSATVTLREPNALFLPSAPRLLSLRRNFYIAQSLSSSSSSPGIRFNRSTRLFVSGLSFRTTEESLRNAFKTFGELVAVNLVMDKIANRPRGFAFLRYNTEEESKKAIEGMHGKFLDGRVIFVEIAKSRAELRHGFRQSP